MLTYLFDASAAVEIYVPRDHRMGKCIGHILEHKTMHEASLFIPNFCIAEVFNTLARMRFDPTSDDKPMEQIGYEKALESFRGDVHWGRRLYPYDLNRYHIVAADKIIAAEHGLGPKGGKGRLSTFDILIIAMACELAWIGRREDTYLLTCDRRLRRVFDHLGHGDFSGMMVEGPLGPGALDEGRWVPPKCICLFDVERVELRSFRGQAPLSI
jgi:hypothetical protein